MHDKTIVGRRRQLNADQREYRLYTALLFPFAFVAVLLARIWPRPGSIYLTGEAHSPFLSEVTELCRSAVPWVFMGR